MRTTADKIGGMNKVLLAPHAVTARPGRREMQKVAEYRPAMRLDPIGSAQGLLVSSKQALFEIAYWVGFGRTGYLEARNVRNQTLAIAALACAVLLVCTSKAPNNASITTVRRAVVQAQAGQTATKVSEADQQQVTEVTVEGVPPASEQS